MTMEKNILKSIKRELDEIKKEAKSEELEVEDIIFDEYDEALINEPTKRNFKAKALKKGMAAAMLGLTLATGFSGVPNTNNNMATVEAAKKKDKKKPVIKFAGSSKIETEVNKTVKIPKTTAKDNKDGNVTKKIAVKVTKGKKQFKSIAKKIKSNKAVTFTSTGNYVITYTVKDKAGNKATKKRYVTVKEAQKTQTTRRPAPARVVPAPATTEAPTTTEIPTTEATTEAPTTEKEYPIYKYNIVEEKSDEIIKKLGEDPSSEKIKLKIENDYSVLLFDENSPLFENSEYLKYLGKITATDEYGNDISENIVIYELGLKETMKKSYGQFIYIYVEDSKGNEYATLISIGTTTDPNENLDEMNLIDKSNHVYGKLRYDYSFNNFEPNKKKILKNL